MPAPSSQLRDAKKKAAQKASLDHRSPDSKGNNTLLLSPGARNIVQAALREDVSVAELAELATTDPAFATRILSVANSAAYTRSRNVTNVQQACALLGIRGMRNTALGMLVADLVPAAEGAGTLLSSCLRRAVIARSLADHSGTVQREDGFFAGLLLEIGLLHQACDHFEECLEVCRSPGRHRVTRERAAGLAPHPINGGQLAHELCLPITIEHAIYHHHDPMMPEAPMSALCWVTEICAAVFEAGDEAQNRSLAEDAAHRLGVAPDDLNRIFETTTEEVNDLATALECAGGPNSQRGIQRPTERDLAEMHLQYEELIQVLVRVMDERDRLQSDLDDAHLALARAGLARAPKGSTP